MTSTVARRPCKSASCVQARPPSSTGIAPRRIRRASADVAASRPRVKLPKLAVTVNTEYAERFLALPPVERCRRLDEWREACAPAFESVDDYLAWKRGENAVEN